MAVNFSNNSVNNSGLNLGLVPRSFSAAFVQDRHSEYSLQLQGQSHVLEYIVSLLRRQQCNLSLLRRLYVLSLILRELDGLVLLRKCRCLRGIVRDGLRCRHYSHLR